MQNIKRQWLVRLSLLPIASLLSACQATAMGQRTLLSPAQQRLQNMGLTLVVDAVEGAEMLGVEFFADGNEFPFFAHSRVTKRNRGIMAFPSGVVPERVRVMWRVKNTGTPFWWLSPYAVDDFGKSLDKATLIEEQLKRSNRKPGPETSALINKEKIEKRKTIVANLGIAYQGPWGGEYLGDIVGDHTFPVASRIPDDVIREIRKNGGGLRLKFRLKPDGVLFGWDIERFAGGLPRHSMPGGDFLETWY